MKLLVAILAFSISVFAQGIGGKAGVGGSGGFGGGATAGGGGTPYALDGTHHAGVDNQGSVTSTFVNIGTPTAGDLITCEISFSGASTFVSVADATNAGNYTAACPVHKNTTINQFVGIYYHTNAVASSTVPTLTYTTASAFQAMSCQAWTPGTNTQVQDGSCIQRDLTATANPTVAAGTTSPAGNNELILCALQSNANTPTQGTNFTLGDSAPNTLFFPEFWAQTTGTATNCPYVMASDSWTDQMVFFK